MVDRNEIVSQTVEMVSEGDLSVLNSLLTKKKLLMSGDPSHKQIRTALVFMGGAQSSGAIIGGVSLAIEESGITEAFDNVLGVSAGSVAGYYLVAGQIRQGIEITTQDAYYHRLLRLGRPDQLADFSKLEMILRRKRPVSNQRLIQNRTNLQVGLTDMNGDAVWINAKDVEDPIELLIGSMSHPLMNGGKAKNIGGNLYVDGCIASPLPIKCAAERFDATDILVVLSRSPHSISPTGLGQRLLEQFHSRNYGSELKKAISTYDRRFTEEAKAIINSSLIPFSRVLAVYPKVNPIQQYTTDPKLLWTAVEASADYFRQLIGRV